MKINVETKFLSEALKKTFSIVSPRSTLAVLNNIFLSAKDGYLSLTTTDLEVRMLVKITAKIEEEGEATIPAKTFVQIVHSLSEEEVNISTDPTMISSITSGKAAFKLMGIDPHEFPKEEEISEEQEIVFRGPELKATLRKTAYAVSADPTRIVLTGILFSISQGILTTVATDGRRLAIVEKNLEGEENTLECNVILPIKVVQELQRLIGKEDVVLKVSESRIMFFIGDSIITSRLIDGVYPNYQQVIPDSFENTVTLPRETFLEALNRVSVVVQESGAPIEILFNEAGCTLRAHSMEIGEAEETLPISYKGKSVTISFNPSYMREPLKNLDADQMTLRFNDGFKPVAVLGDQGFLYILMPMQS